MNESTYQDSLALDSHIKTINGLADIINSQIESIIEYKSKTLPRFEGAIVESINSDGSVNIYIPPDEDKVYYNIKNECPFILESGDCVELLLKNGSFSNCWIVAKHGDSYTSDSIPVNTKIIEGQGGQSYADKYYTAVLPTDGTTTLFKVEHNLQSINTMVFCYNQNGVDVYPSVVKRNDENTIYLTFNPAPARTDQITVFCSTGFRKGEIAYGVAKFG